MRDTKLLFLDTCLFQIRQPLYIRYSLEDDKFS